jgi:hypothetical protein
VLSQMALGVGTAHMPRRNARSWVSALGDALAKRSVKRTISAHKAPGEIFALVAENDEAAVTRLTRREFIIDRSMLERHFESIQSRIGHMAARTGSRFSQGVALKFAKRFGRKYAEKIGIPSAVLSDAWYFAIWAELCTLIPIRHVARHIAKLAGEALVLVPLDARDRRYLSFWNESDIEPFLLVAALRKAGANACLYLTSSNDRRAALSAGEFRVRLMASAAWDSQRLDFAASAARSRILVPSGIRSIEKIHARIGNPLIVSGDYALWPGAYDFNLISPDAAPRDILFQFTRYPTPVAFGSGISLFKAHLRTVDLGDWLFEAIGETTRTSAIEARRLVRECDADEAHVCDVLFYQSSLIAHAVRERGGLLTVWPHSSNAIHVGIRQSQKPDRVICVTRSAEAAWRSRFPKADVQVASELLFRKPFAPQPLSPDEPIHVVIMAGANRLARMPIVDQSRHMESYRRLFARLEELGQGFRFVVKPKPPFEPAEWLEGLLPPITRATMTSVSPSELDLPNMIFLTVSFASTTIFDGIGRGVPSMVVRETDVEDYVDIDPPFIPIGTVDQIIERLKFCAERTHLHELTIRQIAWYAAQTHFGN